MLCLAQKIGSDCSFFLTCGLAAVSGRGENSRDVSFSKSDIVYTNDPEYGSRDLEKLNTISVDHVK